MKKIRNKLRNDVLNSCRLVNKTHNNILLNNNQQKTGGGKSEPKNTKI